MLDWIFGYDDPVLLPRGVAPGSAALSLSTGPASIYSQNASASFGLPGWSAGVAGGNNPPIAPAGNPTMPQTSGAPQLSPLLVVAAAFVVVYLIVRS